MSDADPGAQLGAEDIFGVGRPIGEILSDFRLIAKLGEGGMGVVYRAHQLSMDRDVALKILPPRLADNHDFVERFYREARISVKLQDNAGIVHGLAVGFACANCGYNGPPEKHPAHTTRADHAPGLHYFAMEFVEGENLERWLTRIGHLPTGDAVKITIEVARALEYAHSRKQPIFHRDVKPANIMVTPDGEVKLADLGLAKAAEDDSGPTRLGQMAGTLAYMPPEQARNAAMVDGRSDIYALGATLYVLLTGKKPFAGTTALDIVEAKERGKFEPVRAANIEVPEALDRIIAKMLAPDVTKRYQTAGEVVAALIETGLAHENLGFLGEPTLTAPPGRELPRGSGSKHRWLVWMLGSGVAVTLAATAYLSRFPADRLAERTWPDTPAARREGIDTIVAQAMEQLASGEISEARSTLSRGLSGHPSDTRIERPLHELEHGALVLFQHQTPQEMSPLRPIWTADRIRLTNRDNYRFGVVLARECYLYAYQRDTRERLTLIFPNNRFSPLSDPLPSGTLIWLPSDPRRSGTSWFHLGDAVGETRMYFVAVTAPLRDPEGFGNALVGEADHLGGTLERSLSTFLQSTGASAKPCFAEQTALQLFQFEQGEG